MISINFFSLAKAFLVLAVFSVVLVGISTLFPFIVTKYTVFRAAVEISFILFLLGWLMNPGRFEEEYGVRFRRVVRHPLFIAVAIFAGVFVLASLTAYDPMTAFWSNFERGEGGFQMVHLFLFFALLAVLLRSARDWRRLFGASAVAGLLMVGYGLLASAGISGFIGSQGGARFQGSLGNAAYVGAYLLFIITYVLYLAFTAPRGAKRWWLYGLAALLSGFVWFAQTRGPAYGLGAGIVAFSLFLALRSTPRVRRVTLALLAVLLVGFGTLSYFRTAPWVTNLPGTRLFNLGLQSTSLSSRLWTWEAALEGFKERPLLGWGPENFSVVFDAHFDTRHYVPGEPSETWYDRAHSIFLDHLVETGAFGLLAFLSLFAVFFIEFRRALRAPPEGSGGGFPFSPAAAGILLALPVAYLVQGIVLFDILPISLNLFLFLAFSVHLFLPNGSLAATAPMRASFRFPARAGVVALLAAVVVSGYFGTYLPYAKAKSYLTLLQSLSSVTSFEEFIEATSRAFDIPSPAGRAEFLRFFSSEMVGTFQREAIAPEVKEVLLTFVENEYRALKNGDTYIGETQQALTLGQLHFILGATGKDSAHFAKAKEYFNACLALSPRRPQCLLALYSVARAEGDSARREALKDTILGYWPTESLPD